MFFTNLPAGIYFCRLPSFSYILSRFVVVFSGGESLIHAHFILPRAGTLSSIPGEGKDNPLHYSCLENPTDREAWQATVHGTTKSQTCLSTCACTHASSITIAEQKEKSHKYPFIPGCLLASCCNSQQR